EGILDMENEYERFNIRSKMNVDITDRFKTGMNVVFSNATRYAPENAAWFNAYFAVPILPVMDPSNTAAAPIQFANAQLLGYRSPQNPFPVMEYNENRIKIRKVLATIDFQYDIIEDKLDFKTTYSHNLTALEERYVNLPYTLGNNYEVRSSIR
ncbi:TonB-dependent receptor, partial [Salinimicrobium sp. CDJ15-91]|nr:TonB-dependent receptor [Salinimicrobium oceani]